MVDFVDLPTALLNSKNYHGRYTKVKRHSDVSWIYLRVYVNSTYVCKYPINPGRYEDEPPAVRPGKIYHGMKKGALTRES